MKDLLQERIKRLSLIGESAKRRSTVYSGLTKLDDKNTAQSLGAWNRASAPGKKIQKFGFMMLWVPEPTGITCAIGAPMILAGRYLDKKYNGFTIKDIGEQTKETISSISRFRNFSHPS